MSTYDEEKMFRKGKKMMDLLKNNALVLKTSGELLLKSSSDLNKIIDIYNSQYDNLSDIINYRYKTEQLYQDSLKCIELSIKGIQTLNLYNDIQMLNIDIEDKE